MKLKAEWSKSYPFKPRDNLQAHIHITAPQFIPSYEKDNCPIPMNWLIGWEYARMWARERDKFISVREKKSKPKRIENDYQEWLQKRQPTAKKVC